MSDWGISMLRSLPCPSVAQVRAFAFSRTGRMSLASGGYDSRNALRRTSSSKSTYSQPSCVPHPMATTI
jgi:hypothetical protein